MPHKNENNSVDQIILSIRVEVSMNISLRATVFRIAKHKSNRKLGAQIQ